MRLSRVLLLALLMFVGLTVNAKDGWDRLIYGAFAVATLVALIRFRHDPVLAGWDF